MKKFIALFTFLLASSFFFAQCNIVATAMGSSVDCAGDCDGNITYIYQNTGTPGAPYMVSLYNQTTSTWYPPVTYGTEIETILFSNLCAGDYLINIQGTSCSQQTMATVTEPIALQLNVNTIDPSPGMSNGSATAIVSGGTSPYSYAVNGGTYQGSNTFNGLSPGTHTITVMDANGCTISYTFILNDIGNCNMVVTANAQMTSCGACNGFVQFAFTGAMIQGPFVVELINSSNQVVQSLNGNGSYQGAFQNVCAGLYTVQVTDANGCTGSYPISVSSGSSPIVTNVSTTPTPFGTSNGTATVDVSGGTAPYSYSLDGITFQASNSFTGLSDGVHILTVVDANGCQTIYCFIIQETTACSLTINSTSSQTGCYASSNGTISYVFSSANGNATVVLQDANGGTVQSHTASGPNGQGAFNNLQTGVYIVLITDAAGCTYTNTVQIAGPSSPLNVSATTIPATSGSSNGTIQINVSGGTAPYTYSIDNGATWTSTSTFSNLTPNVYVVLVSDANGCISVYTVNLTQVQNCPQAITGMMNPVSCFGGQDGSIDYAFTSDGSAAPFTLTLVQGNNTIQTTNLIGNAGSGTLSNLSAGVYTITLTGANGCVSTTQVYVDEPDPLQIISVQVNDASPGNSDGSAVVNLIGGTAPYSYVLNNGPASSSSNFTNLAAGVYILEVTDANGCYAIYCFIVNESNVCPPLAITTNLIQAETCAGACSAVLGWVYTGGNTSGTYTITLAQNGTVVSTQSSTLNADQGWFPNVCSGNYSITLTDPNGCSATTNYTVTSPAPLVLTAVSNPATSGSANGSINAMASGGTGIYEFSLDGLTWQNSSVFNNLVDGTYIVYVRDENDCVQIYTVIVGTSNCSLVVTAMPTIAQGCSNACNSSIAFAYTSSGGTAPFTVNLIDQGGNSQVQTYATQNATGQFTGLCSGVYVVQVTDANGCTGVYTIQLVGPSNMNINLQVAHPTGGQANGALNVNVSGGFPSYVYSLNAPTNFTANSSFTNLSAGVYQVYTKDNNECTQVHAAKLGENSLGLTKQQIEVLMYPNPSNDFILIEGLEKGLSFSITNVGGQEIKLIIRELESGFELDVRELQTGMYFIQAFSSETVWQAAFVKQ